MGDGLLVARPLLRSLREARASVAQELLLVGCGADELIGPLWTGPLSNASALELTVTFRL